MTDKPKPKPLRTHAPALNQTLQQRHRDKRKQAAQILGFDRVADMINAIHALSPADAKEIERILKKQD